MKTADILEKHYEVLRAVREFVDTMDSIEEQLFFYSYDVINLLSKDERVDIQLTHKNIKDFFKFNKNITILDKRLRRQNQWCYVFVNKAGLDYINEFSPDRQTSIIRSLSLDDVALDQLAKDARAKIMDKKASKYHDVETGIPKLVDLGFPDTINVKNALVIASIYNALKAQGRDVMVLLNEELEKRAKDKSKKDAEEYYDNLSKEDFKREERNAKRRADRKNKVPKHTI